MTTMLTVPAKRMGTAKTKQTIEVPCYQCLFTKLISDGWCDPVTCEMLEFWIKEKDFNWDSHVNGWQNRLELKMIKKNLLYEV